MSVRKDQYIWWTIVIGVIIIVVTAIVYLVSFTHPRLTVRLGDGVFRVRLAQTPEEREKGLAGVSELRQSDGMLFVFDNSSKHGIHMKDMKVPIDVIWLDNNKKVVHIVRNMTPATYPKVFKPERPARYVLEIGSGTALSRRISVGSVATFDLDEIFGVRRR